MRDACQVDALNLSTIVPILRTPADLTDAAYRRVDAMSRKTVMYFCAVLARENFWRI